MKTKDLNINKLLEDMQRNVDYAYDKGLEQGKQQTLKDELEFLKELLREADCLCSGCSRMLRRKIIQIEKELGEKKKCLKN